MDYSPPGSSLHGILQARIMEWVAIFFSRGSSRPRGQSCVFCIGRQSFSTTEPPGKPHATYEWAKLNRKTTKAETVGLPVSRKYHSDTENKPCYCSRALSHRTGTRTSCWRSSADQQTKQRDFLLLFQSQRRRGSPNNFSAQPSSRNYYHFFKNSIFCINKMWSIHPRDYYATVKKEWSTGPSYNKSEPLIMLSARSQSQKTLLQSSIYMKVCEYSKKHWIVYFKQVKFMACKLYLSNKAVKKTARFKNKKKLSSLKSYIRNRADTEDSQHGGSLPF